ncbi:MAG: hypothetical protein R3Y07_04725 [Eubacteriales bacterium]
MDKTTVTKNERITYTIDVSFTGSADPSSVEWRLEDFIPSSMDYTLPTVEGQLASIEEVKAEGGTNLIFHFSKVTTESTITLELEVDFGDSCVDGDTFVNQCSLYGGDERLAFSTANIVYLYYQRGYSALKQVKGDLDTEFSLASTAKAGGTATYQLTVRNVHLQPITGVDIVDIFPFVGDTEVTDSSIPRGSQFNIFPTDDVTAKVVATLYDTSGEKRDADLSIDYSTSHDPVRFDASGETIGSGVWISTPPTGNLAAIRVTMGADEILDGGESLIVTALVDVPIGAPVGETAYNSFGVDADELRPLEPYTVALTIAEEQDPRAQAITDLIESVALEQTALSHILNAEGEKIQKMLEFATTTEELISVNTSVESMVKAITDLETALQEKLTLFEASLKVTTT